MLSFSLSTAVAQRRYIPSTCNTKRKDVKHLTKYNCCKGVLLPAHLRHKTQRCETSLKVEMPHTTVTSETPVTQNSKVRNFSQGRCVAYKRHFRNNSNTKLTGVKLLEHYNCPIEVLLPVEMRHNTQRCETSRALQQSHRGVDDLVSKHRLFPNLRWLWHLVSSCFKPTQPQRIISGLRETSIKRYIVERTNKAEIRPEEQVVKAESCQENLWNEISLKEP